MPQSEEVRGFMQKLDTFYELIDEESPVEEAKRTHGGERNSTGSSPNISDVSENDEVILDGTLTFTTIKY